MQPRLFFYWGWPTRNYLCDLPGLPAILLYRRFHGFQLGKVLAHVRMQDHINDQIAKIAKVSLLHVGENVAIVLLDHPVIQNNPRIR